VAERHAAIHAARALLLSVAFRKGLVDFEPVVDALVDGAPQWNFALDFEKPVVYPWTAPWRTCASRRVTPSTR
jgi:hypothetical protein